MCPRTHVEIRGRNGPGRRTPKLTLVRSTCVYRCYYYCCMLLPLTAAVVLLLSEVDLVREVTAAAAAALLLRLVE